MPFNCFVIYIYKITLLISINHMINTEINLAFCYFLQLKPWILLLSQFTAMFIPGYNMAELTYQK